VAAAERASGLRDTVPVGAVLPITAGSAAQILLAWEEPERMHRGLRNAKFTATALAQVRRRGWAASVAEREPGVASVSAPVRGQGGKVIAAASVSGPIERLTRSPGRLHAVAVVAAGDKISTTIRRGLTRRGTMVPPSPAGRLGPARPAWRPYLVLCHHVRTPPHEGDGLRRLSCRVPTAPDAHYSETMRSRA